MNEHRRGWVTSFRSSRARLPSWGIGLAATFLMLGACAQARYNTQLRHELDSARINQPLTEVWPVVLHLLADHGYQLVGQDRVVVGAPPESMTQRVFQLVTGNGFETGTTDHGLALETRADSSRVRLRAEGINLDGKTCRVRFTTIKFAESSEERSPDLNLELELVQRLDPEQAKRINQAAEAVK